MLLQLKKYSKTIIPQVLKKKLSQYEYVFNPSYVVLGSLNYFAVRVYDEFSKSILALLFIWDNEDTIHTINLSRYFKINANLAKVSDPKLFVLNNKVWGTFNTGHTAKNNNTLGIFEIENFKIEQHFLCNYENRSRIEKNWSFYAKDNNIFALYSLSPLTILKLTCFKNNLAYFEDYYLNKTTNFKGYSIGTQLTKLKKDYLFIGHKKIVKKGKRLYFGKVFLLSIDDEIVVKASGKWLIHSIKSLFGNKKKLIKTLFRVLIFQEYMLLKI